MKELEDRYSALFSMATDEEGDPHFGLEIPIRLDLKKALDLVSFRNDPRKIPSHNALTVHIRGIPSTGHRVNLLHRRVTRSNKSGSHQTSDLFEAGTRYF